MAFGCLYFHCGRVGPFCMGLGPAVFVFCPVNGLRQGQEPDRVCLFIIVDVGTVKRIGC